jgi:hypothetical protein
MLRRSRLMSDDGTTPPSCYLTPMNVDELQLIPTPIHLTIPSGVGLYSSTPFTQWLQGCILWWRIEGTPPLTPRADTLLVEMSTFKKLLTNYYFRMGEPQKSRKMIFFFSVKELEHHWSCFMCFYCQSSRIMFHVFLLPLKNQWLWSNLIGIRLLFPWLHMIILCTQVFHKRHIHTQHR